MCCERWSTRKTLTWIRDYHGPDGGDPHENKHRAATEALTLMDERDTAVALLRRIATGDEPLADEGTIETPYRYCFHCGANDEAVCGVIAHEDDCLWLQSKAFLATLTPAEGAR